MRINQHNLYPFLFLLILMLNGIALVTNLELKINKTQETDYGDTSTSKIIGNTVILNEEERIITETYNSNYEEYLSNNYPLDLNLNTKESNILNNDQKYYVDSVSNNHLPDDAGLYDDWNKMKNIDGLYTSFEEYGQPSTPFSSDWYSPNDYTALSFIKYPDNTYISDNNYAVSELTDSVILTNFNILDLSGSVINGIEVEVEAFTIDEPIAFEVSLVWNQITSMTSSHRVNTVISEQYYQIGDLNYDWGRSWEGEDFNNTNFGIFIQADTGSASRKLNIDHVRIMINYTMNNFVFDREFSFNFNSIMEENFELNIKTGSLDNEILNIDFWDFDLNSWQSLDILSPIDSNSWKNISIDSLINSPGFHFRFEGFSETDDSIKDIWEIDALFISYKLKARHFTYRKNITIDNTSVSSDLQNFPLLLEFYDSDLQDNVHSSGNDILFADSFGYKLAHEIELFDLNYNSTHSYLISWVRVPTLSSITDTLISVYFGNETISNQENANFVWNSDFLTVQHMEETSLGSIFDSTINNQIMDPSGIITSDLNSIIGNGINITQTAEYESQNNISLLNSFTISFWFKAINTVALNQTLFWTENIIATDYLNLFIDTDGNLSFENSTKFHSFGSISADTWYQTYLTYNAVNNEVEIYINGTKFGTTATFALDPLLGLFKFGDNFEGYIDEWRVYSDVHSSNWIVTEYNNQRNPRGFYSIGEKEDIQDQYPPEVIDFGVDDSGDGNPTFWALVTDDISGVENVILSLNSTLNQMTLNNSDYWVYSLSVEYDDFYEYQIKNATDYTGKNLLQSTEVRNKTFNFDTVFPSVMDWEYYPSIGNYGTFNANVTDSWGDIDSVIVNITNAENTTNIGKTAKMQLTSVGYINDTMILVSGTIYFKIIVNDTIGNTFTSNEHQSYVLEKNHAPSIIDAELLPDPISSSDILILNYTYFDLDEDEELGSIIHWFINDVYNPSHDNKYEIAATYLFKNDSWYATISPRDGKDFGEEVTTDIVIIQNTEPVLSDYHVSPNDPINISILTALYTYYDVDGDSENISYRNIEWYRNGYYMPLLDNSLNVGARNTTKGDNWYFRILVHDSSEYSIWYTSVNMTIINAAPTISGIPTFNKTEALTPDDNVKIEYLYYDVDYDPNGSAIVYWYKNGVYQPLLDNQTILYSTDTGTNEFWYYIIMVFDNYDYSGNYTSVGITIGNPPNSLPYATDLDIIGLYSQDNLELFYIFNDDDGHPEAGTEIRWWKSLDGGIIWILVSEFNDTTIISSTVIFRDEQWKFGVHPKDGLEFGDWINSSIVIILNTAPQVDTALIIDGNSLYTTSELIVIIEVSDYDNDEITDYWIKWYVYYNESYQVLRLENQTSVQPEDTLKGELWYCEILVFDGISWSTVEYESNHVEILNTIPYITNITLTGGSTTEEGVTISYDFVDPDNDVDESTIIWLIQSGTGTLYNYTSASFLPNGEIVAGDLVSCFITPNDGNESNTIILTSTSSSDIIVGIIIVGNTIPIITEGPIIESGGILITSATSLYVNYSIYDRDGDDVNGSALYDVELVLENGYWLVTGAEYQWHKNGVLQSSLEESFVNFQYLSKNDVWMVRVRIKDRYGTFSNWYNSTEIIIGNSAPIIQDISWSSEYPTSANDIILIYEYYDFDIDIEGFSLIYWYINGEKIDNDNQTELSSDFFVRGDQINVIIIPYDNFDYGQSYNSTEISGMLFVFNSKPVASNIEINNLQSVYTTDNLLLNCDYFDYDGDIQSNKTIVYWYLNGEFILSLENQTMISSLLTTKGQYWRVIVRVHDGFEYSVNVTSNIVIIQNSKITVDLVEINLGSNSTFIDDDLVIFYEYTDPDGDNVDVKIIYWYINGVYDESLANQLRVPAFYLSKGDEVFCIIRLSDNGFDWSLNKTSELIIIINKFPSISDFDFIFDNENLDPINDERDFYIEDEDIIINYFYLDIEGDSDLTLIHWYLNGTYLSQYDGRLIIYSNITRPGDIWYVIITPYDGYDYGDAIVSKFMIIIGRPEIFDYGIDTLITEEEGQYIIWVNTNVTYNEIDQIEFIITLEALNITLPRQIITSNNGTADFWVFDNLEIIKILEEQGFLNKDFLDYINTTITVQIFVISIYTTTISSLELTFEIYSELLFSFIIEDEVPPRVTDAWFIWNGDQNTPDNITFYVLIEEYGYGVDEVILYYYFNPIIDDINGKANLWLNYKSNQEDIPFENILMIPENSTHYFVTISFTPTSDYEILFNIQVTDQDGNVNKDAYPEGIDQQNIRETRFIYAPPAELPWGIIIGIAILLIIISVFAIRFFSKTELVGLDIEAVMAKVKDITEEEIIGGINLYTLGIIVSLFDQQHGPLPIIVEPVVMKDNFKTLINLSDSSFRSSGFVDTFDKEINTIFDFKLSSQLFVSSLTFAFALERKEARGGAENVTVNVLLNRNVASLVLQFINKINPQIKEIHVLMDKRFSDKEMIYIKILELRKDITKIVLAYEKLYGTTEYLEETI